MGTKKTRQQLEAAFGPGTFQTSADYSDMFASFLHQDDQVQAPSNDILLVDLKNDDYDAFTDSGTGISGYSGGQYEKVGIADLVQAWLSANTSSAPEATEKYSSAKIVVVRNRNFFGNAYDNAPVYVESKGGTVTMGSGTSYENDVITCIPSGACVMFVKRQDSLWSVIDRPISITDYELSQLAQGSNSGYGYGS